jgi:hypothetical protein
LGLPWGQAREQIIEELGTNESLNIWIHFCDQTVRGLSPIRSRKEVKSENLDLAEV